MTAEAPSLTLGDDEVRELAGGYARAEKQLEVLHARGYVRAWRSPLTGKVVLPRAHQLAVDAGAGRSEPATENGPGPNWSRNGKT